MRLIVALSAIALVASPVIAGATRCRDTHGKFVKCTKIVAKTQRCHDAKGHFAKCK